MLVTSLRDGLNLVSHEFVACQEAKRGVLILSEVIWINLALMLVLNQKNALYLNVFKAMIFTCKYSLQVLDSLLVLELYL